jgi:hypothetical protein
MEVTAFLFPGGGVPSFFWKRRKSMKNKELDELLDWMKED